LNLGSAGSDVAPDPDLSGGSRAAKEPARWLLLLNDDLHEKGRCTGFLTVDPRHCLGDRSLPPVVDEAFRERTNIS
jgi:hypothetical protein